MRNDSKLEACATTHGRVVEEKHWQNFMPIMSLLCALMLCTIGCGSKVHDILVINRFDQPVQVEINRIQVGEAVPAGGHAVVGTRYVQMGFMLGVRDAKGKLLYEVSYTNDQQDKMEFDDMVIVEVAPVTDANDQTTR